MKVAFIIAWLVALCSCDINIVALFDRGVVLFRQTIAAVGKVLETVASQHEQLYTV